MFLLSTCLVLVTVEALVCYVHCQPNPQDAIQLSHVPKDYSFPSVNTRVRDLINFFDSLSNHYVPRDTVISLSEAATKLHLLTDSYPLEIKCDKFVKLISMPNIRTFSTVNELVNDNKQFSEQVQTDANLITRLTNERSFDALGRMQTILQSLESEKTFGVSVYEPFIQKELLDCVNYYVFRHQRAISGVVKHVRDSMERLPQTINELGGIEIVLRKFRDVKQRIEQIERDGERGEFNNTAWLQEISRLHDLVIENDYEVPYVIQQFMANPDRLKRLDSLSTGLKRADELRDQLINMEIDANYTMLNTSTNYLEALRELYKLYASYKDILLDETRDFIQEPKRWKLVEERNANKYKIEPLNVNPPSIDDDKNFTLFEIAQNRSDDSKQDDVGTKVEQPKQILTNDLKGTCREFSTDLQHNLEVYNYKNIDSEKAKSLAESINKFNTVCTHESTKELSLPSKWSMVSLTQKLLKWCHDKQEDPSLSELDRASISSTIDMLRKIGGKRNKENHRQTVWATSTAFVSV